MNSKNMKGNDKNGERKQRAIDSVDHHRQQSKRTRIGARSPHRTADAPSLGLFLFGERNRRGDETCHTELLDNFLGQIPVEELISYLEAYPLHLLARYSDKVACYDTMYIVSELPLEEQYVSAQKSSPPTVAFPAAKNRQGGPVDGKRRVEGAKRTHS